MNQPWVNRFDEALRIRVVLLKYYLEWKVDYPHMIKK